MMRLADNIPGKPHRWADAIGAWARGELVQWRYASTEATDADWRDCDYPSRGMPNWSYPGIEYRAALSSHQAATDKDSLTVAPVALGAIGPEGRAPEMLQDCDRGLSKWLSNTPDARRHAREAAVALGGEPPCNPHPDAPHGYNRNASHNAGRYVCDCEGWAALGGEKGEAVAWMWQHEETGQVGFIDPWQKESGWEQANPRAKLIRPLFAAPVCKARMLTDEEADHITGMHNTGRSQGDSECATAIQRKFCEVNGITLEAK